MLPKAARMESFEDDCKDSSSATNTVPHIIVACPSCSTKFAVESSLVAAVEYPQFHCSRCDNVFSLEDVSTVLHRDFTGQDTHGTEENESLQERVSGGIPTPHGTESNFTESPERNTNQRGPLTPPLSAPAPYNPPSQAHSSSSSTLGSTNTIPAPIRASDFSVASSSDSHLESSPEHPFSSAIEKEKVQDYTPATTANEGTLHSSPTSPTNTGWVILPEEITHQISAQRNDITLQKESPAVSLPPTVKPNLITSPAPIAKGPATSPPHKGVQQELQFNRSRNPSELTRMQSFAVAAAPLFVVLAVLFIGSYSIRLSPDMLGAGITRVTSLFGGVSPILPPVELTVSKVSFKGVRIASKELVPVVTGVLTNRSQFAADGVTLEALGFDGRGELLISAQAPLRSALGKEKLSELSLDTLKKFQGSLGARSAHIKAGEEVPFTIALIPDGSREDQPSLADINLSQLKYFSARVFAVTSASGE